MTGWTPEHDQPNWADDLVQQAGGEVPPPARSDPKARYDATRAGRERHKKYNQSQKGLARTARYVERILRDSV